MIPTAFGSRAALCLAAALALLLPLSAAKAQETRFDVPFLTVRNLADANGPGAFFGDARSDLRAGRCVVRERDMGGLDSLVDAAPAFLREQLLRVEDVHVLDPADLLDHLQDTAQAPPTALFVHGYLIDFEKGCRRAALLQENARLSGRLLWFSWPSDGDIANYARDEADLYWSVPDLADAIIDLDHRSGNAGRVQLLGHSLGARGVVLALHEVAHRRPDIRLGDVVLLAADMDFGIFARLLPHISPIAETVTIYVSNEDHPLSLSAELHGYSRLGLAGNDIGQLSGVEVIDVSDIPNETASGHLYHLHNGQVGADLDLLLNGGIRASDRPNLIQVGANLWHLGP